MALLVALVALGLGGGLVACLFYPPRPILARLQQTDANTGTPGVRFFFSPPPPPRPAESKERPLARLFRALQAQLGRSSSSDSNAPKYVALTIDDAPSASTDAILDLLERYNVPATFFIIGENGRTHARTLQRLAAAKHTIGHELGNHDWVDRPSALVPIEQLVDDVARTEAVIAEAEGIAAVAAAATESAASTVEASAPDSSSSDHPLPSTSRNWAPFHRWFRPGSGFYKPAMLNALTPRGYSFVLADVYSHDVNILHSPAAITWHMKSRVRDGSILLLHDGSQARARQTVAVLERLLPELIRRGYTFLTLTQMRQKHTP